MKTIAMIMLIIIGAAFLNFIMSAIGLTTALTSSITNLGYSPTTMLLVLVVFYLVLGCFMETLSMMVTTIPIIAPVMIALGFEDRKSTRLNSSNVALSYAVFCIE